MISRELRLTKNSWVELTQPHIHGNIFQPDSLTLMPRFEPDLSYSESNYEKDCQSTAVYNFNQLRVH